MTIATLDHAAIARRVPHHGNMCLLNTLEGWTPDTIHCTANNHRNLLHPMRTASGLLTACAVEYAGQAMALHGALLAEALVPENEDFAPQPGFLASVRTVRLLVERLDGIEGEIHVHAQRLSGDARQILYGFCVQDSCANLLADGRAIVVLGVPLPYTTQEATVYPGA